MTLKEHFNSLFTIISEDDVSTYSKMVELGKDHEARLTNGKETVVFSIRNEKIVVSENKIEETLPHGFFKKRGIVGILDGELNLEDAIRSKLIDCKGTESEILLFFKLLRLLLFVSARSNRAYDLWKSFKET